MSARDPVVDAYRAAHDLGNGALWSGLDALDDSDLPALQNLPVGHVFPEVDEVSVELRGNIARIYDTRPLDEKIRAAVALLRTALTTCGPDTALAVLRIYDDVFTHTHGPDWHMRDEALDVLGYRTEEGHEALLTDPDEGLRHVLQTNRAKITRYHLETVHGFESAGSWDALRAIACHRAIHHLTSLEPRP
jgi:hypothetical protein